MHGLQNHLKTVLLLSGLSGLLLGVGYLVGGPGGLFIGLVFALIMNVGSFWFSDSIVLKLYGAKPITEKDDKHLYNMVKELAKEANLPMPKVCIINSQTPNAFATGRSPSHAAVAFTTGILNLLNKDELRGVAAHELAHIKNRDTLISTIAATMAAVIGYVAMMARWSAIFGGFGGRDNDRGNVVELIVLAIVTPLIATLIQLAISRSREYLADQTGAKFCKDPDALASALHKLEQGIKHKPLRANATTESTAHLFIANPFSAKGLVSLLSTHPPMKKRIDRLKNMKV